LQKRMRILMAVGDPSLLDRIHAVTPQGSIDVRVAETGALVQALTSQAPHVVMIDQAQPDTRATDLIAAIHRHVPHAPVIVVAAGASVPEVVTTMRAGAFAVLDSPVDTEALRDTLDAARRENDVYRDQRRAAPQTARRAANAAIIGRSSALRALLDTVDLVAPSEANCLIVGENGTGKELIADALHAASARVAGPFIKVNCAAIPEGLLESELFGHKKGSFTGAGADREGLFQRANGGTLFLDEIAEMPTVLQAKLLRVLQEREFRPVGGTRNLTLDIRLVCATNVDIDRAVRERRLREDLLFRINTITLQAPPLRERLDDLPLLCAHFVERFSQRYERPAQGLAPAAMQALSRYHWPGNVRELENIIERAVLLSPAELIDLPVLPDEVRTPAAPKAGARPALLTLHQIERQALLDALERANWNKQQAAASLGIYRPTLYSKMRKYAIRDPHQHGRGRTAEL
jgi:two-component system, NtrC family, response regulator HydG